MFVPRSVRAGAPVLKSRPRPPFARLAQSNNSDTGVGGTLPLAEHVLEADNANVSVSVNNGGNVTADIGGPASAEGAEGGQAPDDDGGEVKSFAREQRWPEEGEPVCVVCGRYGEYICDETDRDVCSRECKALHLLRDRDMILTAPAGVGVGGAGGDEYRESPAVSRLTEQQVASIRTRLDIEVRGDGAPKPVLSFDDCHFHEALTANIAGAGYESPTPVQMQVIPTVLLGRDVVYTSATGSGKTLAFVLPLVSRLAPLAAAQHPEDRHALAIVLAPTRELCLHIEAQVKAVARGIRNMRTAAVVGGLPLASQLHRLSQGAQIVVATPGRLVDVLKRVDGEVSGDDDDPKMRAALHRINFGRVRALVIDEVDAMLTMGFAGQLRAALSSIEDARCARDAKCGPMQRIVFSATVPPAVEALCREFVPKGYVFVRVGTASAPPATIKQVLVWVEEASKKKRLFQLIADPKHYRPPVVVFVGSKAGADLLAAAVAEKCDVAATSLHGGLAQSERSSRLALFLSGDCPVLVATGVAGRGLDLGSLQTVINFDMPPTMDEYVHRIGRAGRMGERGWALSFVNAGDKHLFPQLVAAIGTSSQIPPQVANLARTVAPLSVPVAASAHPGGSSGAVRKRPRDESVYDMVKRLSKKAAGP